MLKGVPAGAISARFHATLIRLFSELAEEVGRRHGVRRVALSGGVFQNSRLLAGLIPALARRGFEVYSHGLVPANDGGIALGQAVIAAKARLNSKSEVWDRNPKFNADPNNERKS